MYTHKVMRFSTQAQTLNLSQSLSTTFDSNEPRSIK